MLPVEKGVALREDPARVEGGRRLPLHGDGRMSAALRGAATAGSISDRSGN